MSMGSKEEIEAIWEKLRDHDEAIETLNLQMDAKTSIVARHLGDLALRLTYISGLVLMRGDDLPPYEKYMSPKLESQREAVRSAGTLPEVLRLIDQFYDDWRGYIRSRG